MSRYTQLIELIDIYHPRTIIEVGTHRGNNAVKMCRAALRYNDMVFYHGYDLFEDMTPELREAEMMGAKGGCRFDLVTARLDAIKDDYPRFMYKLERGNTRDILWGPSSGPTGYELGADGKVDYDNPIKRGSSFVFIDGGHSVETIAHDYEALKGLAECGPIVFDDYFTAGADTDKFGCNKLLEGIAHTVLPIEDRFGSLHIRMAMV